MPNSDYALQYAGLGLRVIPIHWPRPDGTCSCGKDCAKDRAKHPLQRKGARWGSCDPQQVAAWARKWPGCNWAIATGKGVLVLDIDGPAGIEQLAGLVREHGPLPKTAVVKTGRGFHVYLRGDLDHSTVIGDILVRGEGGYVIAPPSVHASGRVYSWVDATPMADAPEWLMEWARAGAAGAGGAVNGSGLCVGPVPNYLLHGHANGHGGGAIKALAAKVLHALREPWTREAEEDIRSALGTVPANCQRKPWLDIGMALHSLGWERSDGTDWGYETWLEWSRGGGEKFAGEYDTEKCWRSFRRGGITLATLFHLAKEHGWQRPDRGAGAGAGNWGNNGTGGTGAAAPLPGAPIHWANTSARGAPLATTANATIAIRALGITTRHDVFHEQLLLGGHFIDRWAGDLSDNAVLMLRRLIQQAYAFDPGANNTRDAAMQLCLEQPFNPVIDYLDALMWDGQPRIQNWLTTYLGADDTPLTREIGRLMLVAAVRRARNFGCKFDHIVVLEGKEGTNKSTALRVLAGDVNFSDQHLLGSSDRDQQEAMRGVWIHEIAELAGMRRTEVERVKAFASRQEDRARPAYGRFRVDMKRRCILVATTNSDQYLLSDTGNRRFWPVKTGVIDIEALARDRDQLWAEAAVQEARKGAITLRPALWGSATDEQNKRLVTDAWEDLIRAYTDKLAETSIADVLTSPHIGMRIDAINQVAQTRAARVLTALGFERVRVRTGKSTWTWRYRRT